MKSAMWILILLFVLGGCSSGGSGAPGNGDGDADGDSETGGDGDSDGDGDTDSTGESDGDADGDADTSGQDDEDWLVEVDTEMEELGISLEGQEPTITTSGEGTIADDVTVAGAHSLDRATVDDNSITVRIDDVPEFADLEPGDVIVSAERSFIRRVVSVSINEPNYIIATEDADLSAAFEEGDFDLQVGFVDETTRATSETWVQVDLADTTLYESQNGNLKVSIPTGSIKATPEFDFNLVMSKDHLHLVELLTTGNLNARFQVKVEGEMTGNFSKSIPIPLFEKTTVVTLGFLPVTVTPFVNIIVSLEGSAQGKAEATGGVNLTVPLVHSYKYHDIAADHFVYSNQGQVNSSVTPAFTTEVTSAQMSATVKVEVEMGMKIYSKLSTSIKVGPYLKADLEGYSPCHYYVSAGAAGTFGVHLDAIGEVVGEKEESWDIFDVPYLLADGKCGESTTGDTGIICDGVTIENDEVNWPDLIDSCTIVRGGISIKDNTTDVDLTPLQNVTAIKGSAGWLYVTGNTAITDLYGLASLEATDSNVSISGNSALQNLNGLSSLERLGGQLSITTNDVLQSIDSLDRLTQCAGVSISSNPQLMEASGFDSWVNSPTGTDEVTESVSIHDNPLLETVRGFNGLDKAAGIYIRGVKSSVIGFDGLEQAGTVTVWFGEETTAGTLNAFGILETVENELNLNYLYGITSAGNSFASLKEVSWLTMSVNENAAAAPLFPSLESAVNGITYISTATTPIVVPSFSALHTVSNVRIQIARASGTSATLLNSLATPTGDISVVINDITQVGGFSSLTIAGGGIGVGGDSLEEISGFNALVSCYGLGFNSGDSSIESVIVTVPDLPSLVSVANPESTSPAAAVGILSIDSPVLEHYPSAPKLEQMAYLVIENNDAITDFDGFTGLTSVDWIRISGNPALTTISGLSKLTNVENLYDHTNSDYNELRIVNNSALTSIEGLSKLESVHGDVLVSFNPMLDPTAMSSLAAVGGNLDCFAPTVNYCDAIDWLEGIAVTGTGTIDGTAPAEGCP